MDPSFDTDVLAARTGDRQAFARLVTRYRGLVSSISLSTVGNVATSEDVAQEVFLAAWRDLGSLRNPSSFLPWLRQLTRRRALDAIRGRRLRDRRELADAAKLEVTVDPCPNAQDALLEDERTRAVAVALDALPSDARDVITLYYREGQSIERVALLLGLREDTAKKRLSRARAALRYEVLARFADVVEKAAPRDEFTNSVLVALPLTSQVPATVLSKGITSFLGKKWIALAASGSSLIGLIGGPLIGLWSMRRALRGAIDKREWNELRLVHLAAITNYVLFSLGVVCLPPRGPSTTQARMGFGLALTIVFSAIHFWIWCSWLPRVRARRRNAEVLADPSAATRHAQEDRRLRLAVLIAALSIAGVVALLVRELCR